MLNRIKDRKIWARVHFIPDLKVGEFVTLRTPNVLMASPLIQTTVAGVLLIIFYLYIIKTDPLVSELVANLGLRNKFNKIGR